MTAAMGAAAAASAGALVQQPYGGLTPIMQKQAAALVKASHGKVRLVSGYRTLAEQQALYNIAVQRYGEQNASQWVADPAHSNHVKGSAADFAGDLGVIGQLAPQFGLVAPMAWEPWHLEMASTPTHAHPAAYTTPPPGEANPTQADFSQKPAHVAANLAEGLLGLGNDRTGTAGSVLDQVIGTLVPQQTQRSPSGTGTVSGTTKGNVSPTQLYKTLLAEGLPPTVAAAFTSIAGRESGYDTGAYNGNRATGDDSYGLFQINLLHGGWGPFLQAHGMADPASALRTLQGSAQAAAWIYQSSGLHPWGGYKGMPWWYSVNLNNGVQGSGGAVSEADMQALGGG